MVAQLNGIVSAYGSMEVIRLVPIPVAHLIHHKQTLALFCCILPFAMASDMSWWAVPLTAFVAFTLYGIEGIAQTYADPFGVAKIDINMDDIVEDARREVEVMLAAWQTQGPGWGGIFQVRDQYGDESRQSREGLARGGSRNRKADESPMTTPRAGQSQVRFVVSDADGHTDEESHDAALEMPRRRRKVMTSLRNAASGVVRGQGGGSLGSGYPAIDEDVTDTEDDGSGGQGPDGQRGLGAAGSWRRNEETPLLPTKKLPRH